MLLKMKFISFLITNLYATLRMEMKLFHTPYEKMKQGQRKAWHILKIWPGDLDLWPWSIGFQILLRTKSGTEMNFYVHKQIISCYQNCYKQIVWIL